MENSCYSYPEGKHGAYEPHIDSWEFLEDGEKIGGRWKCESVKEEEKKEVPTPS